MECLREKRVRLAWAVLPALGFLTEPWAKPNVEPSPSQHSIVEDSIPEWGRVAKSPDALIRNALERLLAKDTLDLFLMMPDPQLFSKLYLQTPEGEKATQAQTNFVKEFYYLDNQKLLFRALKNNGGKKFVLFSWRSMSTPIKLKGGGLIHKDVEIRVKDFQTNELRRLFFVQSIYEGPKGCKIWGFEDHKAVSAVN